MTKEEVISELVKLITDIDNGDNTTSLTGIQKLLGREADKSMLQDYLSAKLRTVMAKQVLSDNDKLACSTMLSFLLELSSQNLVDAIDDHNKMLKYCKDKLIELVKALISLGILSTSLG